MPDGVLSASDLIDVLTANQNAAWADNIGTLVDLCDVEMSSI